MLDTGPCAGRPLSGEERTVGYHNDANHTVGATSHRATASVADCVGDSADGAALGESASG